MSTNETPDIVYYLNGKPYDKVDLEFLLKSLELYSNGYMNISEKFVNVNGSTDDAYQFGLNIGLNNCKGFIKSLLKGIEYNE